MVNVYDRSPPPGLSAAGAVGGAGAILGVGGGSVPVGARRPVPRKALMNLTTGIDTMSFRCGCGCDV